MNLKPLGDRVVVEHVEQAEKSAGGVFLPDTAKEKPQEGRVLAVGTGRVLDNGTTLPVSVKVGDRILYSKYSGSEIKLEGSEYLIISEKTFSRLSMNAFRLERNNHGCQATRF